MEPGCYVIDGYTVLGISSCPRDNRPIDFCAANEGGEKIDLLLRGHVMGLFPQDKDLSVGGSRIPNTDVRGTIGAGIKFDIYPWFTKNIVGAEIEAFGLGGSGRAPRTTSGSGTTQAQGSLITLNTMYNVVLRYPSEAIQPYIGVGGGTSTGILYNVDITSGNGGLTGSSGDFAFAYQFLGGVGWSF